MVWKHFALLMTTHFRGELLFMRAFAYYHLAVNFCPAYGYGNDSLKILVKRDKATYSSVEAMQNQPTTTGQIYNLIVSDLKQAKELLPAEFTTGMHASYESRARANKWAASAFLAQVYFTMRKFTGPESALTELNYVINEGGYSLENDLFKNYNNQDINPKRSVNNEVIMWVFYADNVLSKWKYQHRIKSKMEQFSQLVTNGYEQKCLSGNGLDEC